MNNTLNLFDWQHIDTVLLDMDGTLLDLHFDNYFWLSHLPMQYAAHHNVSIEHANRTLQTLINERVGSLQWYCLDHWSELVNMDIMQLKHEIKHKIAIRPHVPLFLEALREAGKHIVLITNAHPAGLELKLDVTQLSDWLDVIISSHEFKQPKEHPLFWQALSNKITFNPQRTLFVDDTPRILHSAEKFGIANLLCISEPDSQKPRAETTDFLNIAHFDELLPLNI